MHWEERSGGSSPSNRRCLAALHKWGRGMAPLCITYRVSISGVFGGSDARSLEEWKEATAQIEENIKDRLLKTEKLSEDA